MSITRKLVTGAIFATGLTAISAVTASAAECIAPADPGGGWEGGGIKSLRKISPRLGGITQGGENR